jgi:hypothetical protein
MKRMSQLALPVVLIALALTGCMQGSSPEPSGGSSDGPDPSATPTPDPTLAPGGTAEDNLGYFDLVNNRLLASNPGADGRAIIDNLVAAGFDRAAMQVTPDRTAINGEVDSILFSVQLGDSCLLGQRGGGGYTGSTAPALTTGSCLLGKTRPIDW